MIDLAKLARFELYELETDYLSLAEHRAEHGSDVRDLMAAEHKVEAVQAEIERRDEEERAGRSADPMRAREEAYHRHTAGEHWGENREDWTHPDGCFFCGGYAHPSDCCPDRQAVEEYWEVS